MRTVSRSQTMTLGFIQDYDTHVCCESYLTPQAVMPLPPSCVIDVA